MNSASFFLTLYTSALVFLLLLDMMQTLKFRSLGFKELNPILGSYPTPGKVIAYFAFLVIATPVFLDWVSTVSAELALLLALLFLALQTICVTKNHLKGF